MLIFDKLSRTIKHELLVCKANEATKVCDAMVQIAPWVGEFPYDTIVNRITQMLPRIS
jgi:hypothetical protein